MMQDIILDQLFIFDIETAPGKASYTELPENMQNLFEQKVGKYRKEGEDKSDYYFSKAGIFAEFGKIICISCGYLNKSGNDYQLKIKTLKNHNEKQLLIDFSTLLQKVFAQNKSVQLCGHNIKEFDVPWLCRRMLVQGIALPFMLDLYGKKPWEVNHVDTLELWKFGDYKNYTSLNLLATILDIATPKDDIDGSMVGHVYYIENNLDRIATYCCKDVITVAQIMMRLKGLALLKSEHITISDS